MRRLSHAAHRRFGPAPHQGEGEYLACVRRPPHGGYGFDQRQGADVLRRAQSEELDFISLIEVKLSFKDGFAASGLILDDDQLEIMAHATEGYAYLIQLIGYYVGDLRTCTARVDAVRRDMRSVWKTL